MGSSSTPNTRQHLSNESTDGCDLGLNAASLVGMHGAAVIQAAAIANPSDLATCIDAINAIRVALTNKGIIALYIAPS